MTATQEDSTATANNKRKFRSPNRVLARSFRLARDKWKQKYMELRAKLKSARQLRKTPMINGQPGRVIQPVVGLPNTIQQGAGEQNVLRGYLAIGARTDNGDVFCFLNFGGRRGEIDKAPNQHALGMATAFHGDGPIGGAEHDGLVPHD